MYRVSGLARRCGQHVRVNSASGSRSSASGVLYQSATATGPTVKLYTKVGCTLCDEVLCSCVLTVFTCCAIWLFQVADVLFQVAASSPQYNHTLEAVDITDVGNEHWQRAYQYDIPVLHLNDKFWIKHRLAEAVAKEGLDLASNGLFEAQAGEPTGVKAKLVHKL